TAGVFLPVVSVEVCARTDAETVRARDTSPIANVVCRMNPPRMFITARLIRAVNYHQKATTRGVGSLPSHVVVHRELVRMGAETQRVIFLLFQVDPVRDEVFVEDVAAQQEGMIGLECFDCPAK